MMERNWWKPERRILEFLKLIQIEMLLNREK